MPSLFRFIAITALCAAAVYGAMLALATFVHPVQREIVVPVPLPTLNRP